MDKLKWFAGGDERRKKAISELKKLSERLNETTEVELKELIRDYLAQLETKQESVPFILSRFNIEISNCLSKYSIKLSVEDEESLKNISDLSQIRYGY
ncbi:bacteriocin immunity protein [Enterococcus alishanensis]